MESKDRVSWNSILTGFSQSGLSEDALKFFKHMMRERKVKLDHISFVAVLTACSHIGLVDQGRHFLKTMASDYGIPLRMEHYACAIDLLGRAGHLNEAKLLIESMPHKPDAMVWKTLLAACRACGDLDLATQVASHLLELEPGEHCSYVILSNMYARLGKWDKKASLTRLMKERKVKKVPGWSWIEVNNEVHSFIADDRSSTHCQEIYRKLNELMEEMKWLESVVGTTFDWSPDALMEIYNE
ncbi:unnamed protein product [Linum tenue]|uniref:Pentatricopeptide repeat-containing protein n=1 Tax=Linum tenue TaxID=586396 RepID=A0AAV0M4W6_9ROSI|nr:unnamed protein product [Linum tenue]